MSQKNRAFENEEMVRIKGTTDLVRVTGYSSGQGYRVYAKSNGNLYSAWYAENMLEKVEDEPRGRA